MGITTKLGAESGGDAHGSLPLRRSDQLLPQAEDPSAPARFGVAQALLAASLVHIDRGDYGLALDFIRAARRELGEQEG